MKRVLIHTTLFITLLASCSKSPVATGNKTEIDKIKTGSPIMENQNYTTTLLVDQSPAAVFHAVNNVRGWWSQQVEGSTDQLNAEFDYHYQDVHRAKMKIIEFVPEKKVVWLVKENHFNFTKNKTEWTDTKISFEIAKKGDKTELLFTHIRRQAQGRCV